MRRAHDAVYELEIAFSQIAEPAGRRVRRGWSIASSATCWWTSPATRIAPSSASTSCIRPTRATGRLGLLELRALRDAAARAHEPGAATAGARADRLVLEAALRSDADPLGHAAARPLHAAAFRRAAISATCIDELQRAGYPFEPEWFAPHFEFRFPVYGRVSYDGIELELRQAIEPWYVLGEEPARRRHGALRGFVGRAPAGASRAA